MGANSFAALMEMEEEDPEHIKEQNMKSNSNSDSKSTQVTANAGGH
jgi:hypothetical protein